MEFVRGLYNLRARHRGCVATIGNFDGVHRGHRAVLDAVCSAARHLRLPSVVVCFEPTPKEYFAPESAPPRIMGLRDKVLALAEAGIERLVCLRFGAALATLEPEEFIRRVVHEGLGARRLIVGDDFRFGRERRGDYALLEAAGARYGFEVSPTPTFVLDGGRVSSSRLRERLAAGDLDGARVLLGRDYRITGRVVYGDGRGRALGFPTANVALGRRPRPLHGIFLVRVAAEDLPPCYGVASLGTRPTVAADGPQSLEVHVLDFEGELYGRHLQVDFLVRLRDERRFASLDELRDWIARDVAEARRLLRRAG
ncbi:MAG TPA: bifunctional riboflavin kinase/FAD synthetase [Gammaproteobacteria bacterium]|nr:bifunctional riboflavin kinase/FAD synthetase [Gammaproteobacteria bacterium]